MLAIFGSGEEIFQKVAALVKGKTGKKVTHSPTPAEGVAEPHSRDPRCLRDEEKGIRHFE